MSSNIYKQRCILILMGFRTGLTTAALCLGMAPGALSQTAEEPAQILPPMEAIVVAPHASTEIISVPNVPPLPEGYFPLLDLRNDILIIGKPIHERNSSELTFDPNAALIIARRRFPVDYRRPAGDHSLDPYSTEESAELLYDAILRSR